MATSIAIIDYGMGNLYSLYKKLYSLNTQPFITSTSSDILKADKIILPGVGHFESACQKIKSLGIEDALHTAALIKKVPVLGICLGMQLMAKHSEEGDSDGLGWIDAQVKRFAIKDKQKHKVPQTGWNSIHIHKNSHLLHHLQDDSEFYFLHSYHYAAVNEQDALATTTFEYDFVSAIEKENLFGTQFHPEKSHQHGTQLLKNFISL